MLPALLFSTGICGPCQVDGPPSASEQPAWLASLVSDRNAALAKVTPLKLADYPSLKWTVSSYIQTQMHPYDRYFYDPVLGAVDPIAGYTPHRYLADLRMRFGGIDSLLMWPTYPDIGIDDRNQFDFFRAMPGGLAGVANVTAALHAEGVRVLWPYNPWDTGTRREGHSDAVALAELIKQTGGDGFNGDTMNSVPDQFWQASLDAHHPLAFEPEGGGSDAALNWTTMGWGYWMFGNQVPIVDRLKFVSHGQHLTNACDRWSKNYTNHLQAAWFNGDGFEAWENVWGTWNGITPRDGEAIRRVATLLRFFGGSVSLLQSRDWEPHAPVALQQNVYVSRWPAEASDKAASAMGLRTLWTVANRQGRDTSGPQLRLSPSVAAAGGPSRYYDCYHGVELTPTATTTTTTTGGGAVTLAFEMESEGFGCVVETNGPAQPALAALLAKMARLTKPPLASYSHTWTYLPQTMKPIGATPLAASAPEGMVHVPATTNYTFVTRGIEVEGDDQHGVDVQFPWEPHPQREHSHSLPVGPFFMDIYPVTNARYAEYLKATNYTPADSTYWLRHWNGSATPPPALAQTPVVYVSLDEARGFCAWAGGRLPHVWEWQYAAQGTDGRLYPWGSQKTAEGALPAFHDGNTNPGPPVVGQHSPAGDSPFGVADMVGTVWQYTTEFYDEHTRFVVLRGGSNYRPTGSKWYFPNMPELNTHEKYFLMSASYERAGALGFRCVTDALK